MRRTSTLLVLSVVVAACGVSDDGGVDGSPASSTPISSATSTPPSTVSGSAAVAFEIDPDDLNLVVVPGPDGSFESDLMVGCDTSEFPLSAIGEIDTVPEDDPEGYLTAIAQFLDSEEGKFWPQGGWQLLWAGEQNAYLVNQTADGNVAWMYLQREGSDWKWSGSSIDEDPCELRVGVPKGMNTVEWRLDPERPSPTPESTEIPLLLTERECVSGEEIGDRLRGPQIVMTKTEVRVAFVTESPPGDAFTCQGNPDTRYVLELPQAIGERKLVDGFELGVTLGDYLD